MDEERMPGHLCDDADREPVARVGTGPHVLDEQIPSLKIGTDFVKHAIEDGGLDRTVYLAPANLVATLGIRDNETILRRPSGAGTRVGDERAFARHKALASRQSHLGEQSRR